jgi:hypothetical protein
MATAAVETTDTVGTATLATTVIQSTVLRLRRPATSTRHRWRRAAIEFAWRQRKMLLVEFGWRGLAVGALGIGAALAVAVALRQVPWATFDRERWAATIQIVGTMITALGLTVAYARATRFRERAWQPTIDRLRRISYALFAGRPVITGTMGAALQPPTSSAGREGPAPFVRLRNASTEDRIKALEANIDRLIGEDLPSIIERVNDVKADVVAARSLAKSEAENALAKAREAIRDIASNVDRTQTLDLRWAILGLLITAGGMVLGWA